jgi:hypothetical protein
VDYLVRGGFVLTMNERVGVAGISKTVSFHFHKNSIEMVATRSHGAIPIVFETIFGRNECHNWH